MITKRKSIFIFAVLLASLMVVPSVWAESLGTVYGDKVYLVDPAGALSEVETPSHVTLRQIQLPTGGAVATGITSSADGATISVTLSDGKIIEVDRISFTIISG